MSHQTVVFIPTTTFLCLMLCIWPLTAYTSCCKTCFTLTEQSLNHLRQEGLANQILKKLEVLKNRKFDTQEQFTMAVRQAIGDDHCDRYKTQILRHATNDNAKIKTINEMQQAIWQLEQRVKEFETEKAVRKEAVRSITQDALSTVGSNINESVTLGGTLEVVGGRFEDFSGQNEGVLRLNTAELDLEIRPNDWTVGSLVIGYDDGTDAVFQTSAGFKESVERINLDTASITIGDLQRSPPFLTLGRIILPFGISTGNPVADILTIENPLTVDVFEIKNTAIGFGLGFPTPTITPAPPPVTPPPVRPLVIKPFIGSLMQRMGYNPPTKPPPLPTPITPAATPPPFNVGFYTYNGSTFEVTDTGGYNPCDHYNITVGFRTQGSCETPYDQLEGVFFCPWSIDIDVDYISSVFDSRFLEVKYQDVIDQIGFVPAMAGSVKSTLGPISLISEWNGAVSPATFSDGLGNRVSITPRAWQITLGYQLDWNPWVEAIGAQGTYLAIGYSESQDLAGVTRVFNNESIRVGFVPMRRFAVSIGEWIMGGVKLSLEYSHNEDYSRNEGGTGKVANNICSALTITW